VYDLIKAIEESLLKKEDPNATGTLEGLAVFNQERTDKQRIGGKVVGGIFKPKSVFDIQREDKSIGSGRVTTMRQAKREVFQVEAGNECGLLVSSPHPIQVGDILVIKIVP
jgi:translation initiation factor IF-2